MKNLYFKYKYSIIGLFISVVGYLVSLSLNVDISNRIDAYLTHLEKFEIDELAIWFKVLLFFVIVNFIVNIERKRQKEKKDIFGSMLYASNHILRNFLNQSQVIQVEAENTEDFDKKTIETYLECRDEAEEFLNKLAKIENIKGEEIYNAITEDVDSGRLDSMNLGLSGAQNFY